jgi:hydrogenase nickel incorporation protein HypB
MAPEMKFDGDVLPLPGMGADEPREDVRVIALEEDIMSANEVVAREVRDILARKKITALNLISSPGSGKTTLLVETLNAIKGEIACGVIEGDQRTSNDAQRIAQTGISVVQVNTRQACHLNASQVKAALEQLPLDALQLLLIENVGNLTCPAAMDLGEAEKVVLMSITEGEDKPAKYPLAFHLAQVLVLTKMDLLPHLRFDLELCRRYAHQVNPKLRIIETSAYDQDGLDPWFEYLRSRLLR